jgi:EmrB/QacA subfamily drug resistance transporter
MRPPPQIGPARKRATLLALCVAAFIISLDVTIVNVALPTLVRQTGATTTDLQWVVDAYNLVFAALVLVAGSMSDRLGRKGMLLAGLAVFGAASLAGSLCTTAHQLIGARALMGLGAAMMFPATLSLLTNVFTGRRERSAAIGLWGATTGVGIATGPIIGGWLLEHYWWGSVFLFMVPVAAGVAALAAWAVPTSRDPRTPRTDWRGMILSAAGMGVLVLGIIQAPEWGWGSARAIGTLAAGAALLAAFAAAEARTAQPMLDIALFRNPRFSAASALVAIAFFALNGFIFLITQYFQVVQRFGPLSTGVRMLPVAGSVAVASVIGTRLAVRIGNKIIVGGGLVLFCAALLWISTVSQATPYPVIAAQMVVFGTGMGLTQAPATEAIMGAVPKHKAGIGSAVNDATRLFGGTLGVAVIGSVAASLYTSRLAATLPAGLPARAVTAARGSVGGAMIAAQQASHAGLAHLGSRLQDAAILAFLHSLAGGCLVAGAVAAAGALVAIFLLPARRGDHPAGRRNRISARNRPRTRGPGPVTGGVVPERDRGSADLRGPRQAVAGTAAPSRDHRHRAFRCNGAAARGAAPETIVAPVHDGLTSHRQDALATPLATPSNVRTPWASRSSWPVRVSWG